MRYYFAFEGEPMKHPICASHLKTALTLLGALLEQVEATAPFKIELLRIETGD